MTSLSLFLTAALAVAPQVGSASPIVNARCPVTGRDVQNHRLYHYVTIRERNYYVYDREAAVRLRQSPDTFLAEDGRPLGEAPKDPAVK